MTKTLWRTVTAHVMKDQGRLKEEEEEEKNHIKKKGNITQFLLHWLVNISCSTNILHKNLKRRQKNALPYAFSWLIPKENSCSRIEKQLRN